jgi:hypothetical protein
MKNLLLLVFLFSSLSFGQVKQVQIIGNGDGAKTIAQLGSFFWEPPIDGTPFVNEIYKKGEALINGKKQATVLMRYNACTDAIEILGENQKPSMLFRRKNIVATFDGKTYKIINYVMSGKQKEGYFNPLNEGKVILYFRPKKRFIPAEYPDHGYDTFKRPIYKDLSSYYIQNGENMDAKEIKLTKKHILKSLGERSSEITKFVSDQNLNLKLEKDVIRLLDFYNSLAPKLETKGAQS